ncbi:phosducin [Novymonas esmeraldas]|uniref:Phosducin n=1 Tax=Novymonas esmeraldas TaxID=1808958 RepID=A0AAW0ERG2_9TRYP
MERTADQRIRTTEWEDVQYRYGNRVGKYETHELEILAQKIADKHQNTCLTAYDPHTERVADKLERGGYECAEGREADGTAAIVDSDDEDDALSVLRRRRLAELQRQSAMERFGVLRHIPGSDYVAEVTEASATCWVVGVLVKPGNSDCEALLTVLRTVAQRRRTVKFVSMISTEAIPNFPDRHLPCVLLYRDKELRRQVTGLAEWQNQRQLDVSTAERVLLRHGVLPRTDDDGDNDAGASGAERGC